MKLIVQRNTVTAFGKMKRKNMAKPPVGEVDQQVEKFFVSRGFKPKHSDYDLSWTLDNVGVSYDCEMKQLDIYVSEDALSEDFATFSTDCKVSQIPKEYSEWLSYLQKNLSSWVPRFMKLT